ncbi:energy transducer TonB [Lacihabitans sp. LS3-19]|uniref:energy transducer TonB n=1 Tax=Lacihabitans sp. LS3-19 TaxID=2487335 RepID=UPI0020CF7702|nr:energy transducer TonB [Lacihabitans sp. LS3-19]MCP9768951.1 energy transducer TonB [Lacihabitans sp. LS3-19]
MAFSKYLKSNLAILTISSLTFLGTSSCGGGEESKYSINRKEEASKEDFGEKDAYAGDGEGDVLSYVKEKPEFIGGKMKMFSFLRSNLVIPDAAKKAEVSGIVYVRFIVEKDGSISDAKVTKGLGHGCEDAAKKVIMSMPNWKPGMLDGKPVRVYHTLPVAFAKEEK